MSKWVDCKLSDFINIKHGYAFKGKYITEEETENILVTPGNFRIGGGFKASKFKYYNSEFPEEYILSEGDLIVTMTDLSKESDTLGYSAKVPVTSGKKYLHNQRIGLVQFKNQKANKDFIYWLMRTKEYQWFIVGSASGTSVMHTSPSRILEYEFKAPGINEQKVIAEILSSIDEKIGLLHRQNKTLESMAETLFRQWFTEEAHEDWQDGTLVDIINFNPKYQITKGASAPYLEMKNVSTTSFNPEDWYYRDFTSGMKFQNGDTILARITPCLENGKTCFISFLEEDQIGWGSTEYIVMRMKEPFHPFISYLFAKDQDFRDFAISSMSGSSGRQRAQAEVLKTYDIKIPPTNYIEKLNTQLEPIVDKLNYNAKQIVTLENLRDTLLPKLMSGEITVE